MNTNKTTYSLASLEKIRAEKRTELEQTKGKMAVLTHAIMAPPETNNSMELWMHYASNGVTAYKGILTCIKLYKRLKKTFVGKNKKSGGLFS